MESVNQTSLENLYKNVQMALSSLDYVSKETDDVRLKEELAHQYEGYETYAGKLAKAMLSRDIDPKEPGFFKKAMLWSGVKMNALKDDSKSHIADMLIQGTTMGLTEIMTLISENGEIMDKEVLSLAEELRDMESAFLERMKAYL